MITLEDARLLALPSSESWDEQYFDHTQELKVEPLAGGGLGLLNVPISTPALQHLARRTKIPYAYLSACPSPMAAEQLNYWAKMHQVFAGQKALVRKGSIFGFADEADKRFKDTDVLDIFASVFSHGPESVMVDDRSSWFRPEGSHICTYLPRIEVPASPDDVLFPGFVIDTSFSARKNLQIGFFIYRQFCTNGLSVPIHEFKSKAIFDSDDPKVELQQTFARYQSEAEEEVRSFIALKSETITDPAPVLSSLTEQVGFSAEARHRILDSIQEYPEPIRNMYDVVNVISASANNISSAPIADKIRSRAGKAFHLVRASHVCNSCKGVRKYKKVT